MKLTPDDPQLTAYALGQLNAAERAAVENCLRQSPELRREVEEIQRMSGQLEQAFAAEPCPDLTPAQKEAVVPRPTSAPEPHWVALLGQWFNWTRALTAAAAVLVVAGILAAMNHTPAKPTEPKTDLANQLTPPQLKGTPSMNSDFKPAIQPTPVLATAMAPLPVKLPMPTLKGTPDDLPTGPNIEPIPSKPRKPFLAPHGVINIAKGKKVTGSDKNPITGILDQITDGDKEAFDDQTVEMRKGTQWIQVDLEQAFPIYAVALWHDHRWVQIFHDVVVQVADDADFTQNIRTLYNSDLDNSSGLGIGTDREYFETCEGRLIDAKGVNARYVRCYSKGSNMSALNCMEEIEVYALPTPSAGDSAPTPTKTSTPEPAPAAALAPANSGTLTKLTLTLPGPTMKGTPPDSPPTGPHIEPLNLTPRAPTLMAPVGTTNLALSRPVTTSEPRIMTGTLEQITDGFKEANDDDIVEMRKGIQWVQIDLGKACQLHGIAFWHDHRYYQISKDIIVQVADDAPFTQNVRTLFNNDYDNSAGLGIGTDREYFETSAGKLVAANGQIARYVRLYSNGNNGSALNYYAEVEVYGLPAEAGTKNSTSTSSSNLAPLPVKLPLPTMKS